jgi:hypothetical protein
MDGFLLPSPMEHISRNGQAIAPPDGIEIQLAMTPPTRAQAYKIRHDGYLSYNYIIAREDGSFSDKYDERQNVRTVVVYKNQVAAATVRVCLFDPSGNFPDADRIPAMEIFGSEIREMTAAGAASPANGLRAVEVTRLARHGDFANDKTIIHALFRAVGYLVLYFQADIVLNACRPHHMPIYTRFGFQKIEEPRQYPNLTYKAGLMACYRSNYGNARRNLSFLRGISTDDQAYASLIAGERCTLDASAPEKLTQHAPVPQKDYTETRRAA